jgi:FkbM family methyltransferase
MDGVAMRGDMQTALRRTLSTWLPSRAKGWMRRAFRVPDTEWALRRLRGAGFRPAAVIDVGAYRGEWSRLCRDVFPDAALMLIEPQHDHAERLRRSSAQSPSPGWTVVEALCGADHTPLWFLAEESNSRVVPQPPAGRQIRDAVQMVPRRLDELTSGTAFENADFLKLDVQGAELDVLRGASHLLGRVEVVMLELSVIPIGDVPRALDVMQFMDEHHFVLYDIVGLNYRPRDNALWQIDALFARRDSSLASSVSWD